jgi:tRNA-dihydrouridine synthase B
VLRIGPHLIDPPYLLAPMASVSEMPFRVLALEMGAGLATTELISAKGIFYKNERTRQYLTYDEEKERPWSVQLFGGEIESMAHAAREAMQLGADIVDINMGCPVKKVTKTGSGSSLLTDPKRAAALVEAMRAAVEDKIPVTAKIRTGWDASSINCVDMAKALEDAGCAAVAVHGRTRAQAYTGEADWDVIGEMVQAVDVPVIGNGDIADFATAKKRMDDTGCAGVMIGRGALGNPWIFTSCAAGQDLPPPTPEARCELILRHFDAHVAFHELLRKDGGVSRRRTATAEQQAVRTFRPHAQWYSRGLRGGSRFRGEVVHLDDADSVRACLRRFFESLRDDAVMDPGEEAEGINYKQAFG